MQVKLRGALVAALVVLVSTGTMLAGAKVLSVFAPPVSGGSTVVVKQVQAKPNAPAEPPSTGLSEAERRGIEDAVRNQLTAIAARDAKRAFAKLAPSTQHYFAQPDQYLEAIASDLPPILATRHFAFLGAGRDKTGANQLVLITDGDGRDWLPTFQVERQSAGDWRVKDCAVQAAVGQLA